ncbi:MAG: hypothetical protein ACKVLH_01400 [Bacteroidia bacterium]|jgi:endogenous inhibitor of DNA gyrase (YacG/DUF329 family)
MKYFSIFFLTLLALTSIADLRPPDMAIHLGSYRNVYQRNDIIQLDITFTNLTNHSNGVLLPSTKNKGKRLLYLAYYSVDSNDFYTNVYTESREMNMDTAKLGQTGWANLDAGKSVTIPIFLNDTKNYLRHNAAYHKLPNLPAGEYQVLAWYEPWDEYMAQYAFKQLNPFGRSDDDFSSNRIYLDQSVHSNYISITIIDSLANKPQWEPTPFCPQDCKLCSAIDDNNWDKVQNIIAKQTDYSNKLGMNFTDTNWLQPHRNIAWMYEGPDAILASLPTYTYRSMIFKNQVGYFYYAATWQLGIIYPGRSRIQQMFRWATRINAPIRSSEVDYKELVKFAPY